MIVGAIRSRVPLLVRMAIDAQVRAVHRSEYDCVTESCIPGKDFGYEMWATQSRLTSTVGDPTRDERTDS